MVLPDLDQGCCWFLILGPPACLAACRGLPVLLPEACLPFAAQLSVSRPQECSMWDLGCYFISLTRLRAFKDSDPLQRQSKRRGSGEWFSVIGLS